MKTKDFSFNLPEELIAQRPSQRREEARLLVVDRQSETLTHSTVRNLPEFLERDTTVVLNDSKVRKARLYAEPADSSGKVEFLLLRPRENGMRWEALARRAKRQRVGRTYAFPEGVLGTITAAEEGIRHLSFDRPVTDEYLERNGSMPLPPYIRRESDREDEERYQTVYARNYGSVAAPTAGLHFTPDLLSRLEGRGASVYTVTLHVGLGTVAPVRSAHVEDHEMHREEYEIAPEVAQGITEARSAGSPVLAVGTTTVRTLESAAIRSDSGAVLHPGRRSTDIFIYPPYQFAVVDRLFTNFHTPESTLLMLVSAFAGFDLIKRAYAEAVAAEYRFFSYGDAMLIR